MNPDSSLSSTNEDLHIRRTIMSTFADYCHIPCSNLIHQVQRQTGSSSLQIAVIVSDLIRENILSPHLFKGLEVLDLSPRKLQYTE